MVPHCGTKTRPYFVPLIIPLMSKPRRAQNGHDIRARFGNVFSVLRFNFFGSLGADLALPLASPTGTLSRSLCLLMLVKIADEQHQSDIPATYRLGWGFICSDLAHVLVSRRANYVWQRLLDP